MGERRTTDEEIEALIPAAAGGDDAAWRALWAALEPPLTRMTSSPRVVGRLSRSEDDGRSIRVEVMARLRDDGFRRLKSYLDTRRASPSLTFMPWLQVVAKRVAIDYLRGHADYIDKRHDRNEGSAAGAWVVPGSLPADSLLPGQRPAMTNRGTAMEMMRYADAALPADQRLALDLWVRGTDFAEIAGELGGGQAGEAERVVRAALERLRRHFRSGGA